MHRAIMGAPAGIEVDHIDNDGLNNTRENLRFATHQQNCFNKPAPKSNTSGFKGVSWSDALGCWTAIIRGKRIGQFDTPEDAALAYDATARELFGEYAYVNFPDVHTVRTQSAAKRKAGQPQRITDAQVAEIRALAGQGVLHREIAGMFGITPQYVSQLHRGLWRKGEVQP
jgi:hypothetical protein